MIDIGAYSSRSNAEHISPEEEMRRLRTGLEILNRNHPGLSFQLTHSVPEWLRNV